jgi:diguanylate cyclase (GGDEF)-like protein
MKGDNAANQAADRPWRTRWSDVWPFVAVAMIGVIILPFGWGQASPWIVVLFLVLTLLTLLMIAIGVRQHRRGWISIGAPLMVFLDLALARYAAGPALASGIAPLVLLPVLWIALKGTRTELIIAGVLSAAFFWVPAALIGPPAYPSGDWLRGLLTAAIALLVAPVIQRGVHQLAAANAQEREASQRAEAVTTRWRALLEQLPDMVVSRVGGQFGDIRQLETLGGSEKLKKQFAEIIMTRHQDAMLTLFERAARDRAEVELSDEPTRRTLEAIAVPMTDAEPPETLLLIRDVTRDREREHVLDRSRRQLAYLADHDPVSGLLNRRRFDQLLTEHLGRSDDGAVLMLDLDLFKQVNDTLGHAAGDRLLVKVSGILRDELRKTDAAARLGGDEFAILLPDADATTAKKVAGRLVERIRESVAAEGSRNPRVTASIGVVAVCAARRQGVDPVALADIMLYQAKARGRGRYVIFDDDEAQLPAVLTATRQDKITDALDHDGFVLQLQPIMNVADSRVVAAEALVRLREDGRLIAPGEFIEVAEGSELITRLDCQIIRQGAALLADLRSRVADFRLAINVSARSIGEPILEQTIMKSLAEHRLSGSALILEVTETAAIADLERAQAFAERMQQLGCSLSLDDFGVGFGTFTRLKRLAFDYVKINGEFVAGAPESSVDRSLVRSIVLLAHDLGKQVVAEYVADERRLELVRSAGADFAQGFQIGEPMPIDEFADHFVQAPMRHRY